MNAPEATQPQAKPPALGMLLGLAWPIVLARATQAVIGFTDALLVSPLGEEPLAATTTGSLNASAAIILPMGTVFIVQSFAAQLRGRGDTKGLQRYAIYGLLIALAAGVLALALIPGITPFLAALDYAPGVRQGMDTYLSIRLLAVGPAVATEALGNWYAGLGNTRLAMLAGIVAMLANAILDYTFIQPHFGLPGYGIAGAAWASVVSTWLGFSVIGLALVRGYGYDLPKDRLELRLREFLRVLKFGLPNGVNWFLEFLAFILYIDVVIGHFGTTVLAAFNVVMQLNSISFMPAFGMASAGAVLVGQTIGAGKANAVWPIVKRTGLSASVWMLSVGLLYLLAPHQLIALFVPRNTNQDSLKSAGALMLALASIWQLFDAVGMTLSEALRAAGDTAWCMAARIVLAWVLFTPLAWAAVFFFDGGVLTVMLSLIAYIAAVAFAFAWRFASGRWRRVSLLEPPILDSELMSGSEVR